MFNRKIDGCKNNPENSSATKVCEHIPSGFSMSIISSFKKFFKKTFYSPISSRNHMKIPKSVILVKKNLRKSI